MVVQNCCNDVDGGVLAGLGRLTMAIRLHPLFRSRALFAVFLLVLFASFRGVLEAVAERQAEGEVPVAHCQHALPRIKVVERLLRPQARCGLVFEGRSPRIVTVVVVV